MSEKNNRAELESLYSLNMRCKYESFGCYYESIHSPPPSGSSAIRGGKNMYCEKVDLESQRLFSITCGVFSLTYVYPMAQPLLLFIYLFSSHHVHHVSFTLSFLPTLNSSIGSSCLWFSLPLTLPHFIILFFFTDIPTNLSDRAVPSAMWQPRCLLRGPVSVWGGLDWRCMRPESVPSSLWRARPVPRRDLHLSAWLGGRALQHWWAACVCVCMWECLIIPGDVSD